MARHKKAPETVEGDIIIDSVSTSDAVQPVAMTESPASEDQQPFVGAIEQLIAASRIAAKDRQHSEHARLEAALFALHTARGHLSNVDLGGAVAAIKALL